MNAIDDACKSLKHLLLNLGRDDQVLRQRFQLGPEGDVVQPDGFLDDLVSNLLRHEFLDQHLLVLQLLVVFEESVDHHDQVRRQLFEAVDILEGDVVVGDSDDLVVHLSLVSHVHHSYYPRLNNGQGSHVIAAQHQDVQRVVVVAVGLRDETVVCGVVDCAEEDSVELEESTGFVDLVLDLGVLGDLDDGVDEDWCVFSGGDSVPGIKGEGAHGGVQW